MNTLAGRRKIIGALLLRFLTYIYELSLTLSHLFFSFFFFSEWKCDPVIQYIWWNPVAAEAQTCYSSADGGAYVITPDLLARCADGAHRHGNKMLSVCCSHKQWIAAYCNLLLTIPARDAARWIFIATGRWVQAKVDEEAKSERKKPF